MPGDLIQLGSFKVILLRGIEMGKQERYKRSAFKYKRPSETCEHTSSLVHICPHSIRSESLSLPKGLRRAWVTGKSGRPGPSVPINHPKEAQTSNFTSLNISFLVFKVGLLTPCRVKIEINKAMKGKVPFKL